MEVIYIKNYDIDIISNKEIKKLCKKKFLTKMDIEYPNIKEKCEGVLNKEGLLICLTKRGVAYGINLFDYNKENKELKLKETIVLDEVSQENKEKFENATRNIIEEMLTFGEFNNIESINIKGKKIKSSENLKKEGLATICISLGIIFGVMTDNIIISIIIALLVSGLIYATNDSSKESQDKKTRKNKSKNDR